MITISQASAALAESPSSAPYAAAATRTVRRTLSDHGLAQAVAVVASVPELSTRSVNRRLDVRCRVRIELMVSADGPAQWAIVSGRARVTGARRRAATQRLCVVEAALAATRNQIIPFVRQGGGIARDNPASYSPRVASR